MARTGGHHDKRGEQRRCRKEYRSEEKTIKTEAHQRAEQRYA